MTELSGEREASWGWVGREGGCVRRCGGEAFVAAPVARGAVFPVDGGAETAAASLVRYASRWIYMAFMSVKGG